MFLFRSEWFVARDALVSCPAVDTSAPHPSGVARQYHRRPPPSRPVHSRAAAAERTSLPPAVVVGLCALGQGGDEGRVSCAAGGPASCPSRCQEPRSSMAVTGRSRGFSLEGVCDLTLPGQPLGSWHGAPQCHRAPCGDTWLRPVSSGGTLAHGFPSLPPLSPVVAVTGLPPPTQAAGGGVLRPAATVAPRCPR